MPTPRPLRILRAASLPALLAPLVPGTPLAAQGYALYEQGACAMGRAGAAVAAPCEDGSTLVFNPAGLAKMPALVSIGGTGVFPGGSFTNATSGRRSVLADESVISPNLYLAAPMGRGVVAGLGVFNPYGLSLAWAPNSEGRFVGYRSVLRTTYVQPTIAAKFGDLSLGAGVNFGFSSVRLERRLDLAAQATGIGTTTFAQLGVPAGTDFADVNLTASDFAVGWHAGALWRAHERLSFGGRYLARQTYRYKDGRADVTAIPTGVTAPADVRNPLTGAIVIPRGTPFDAVVAPQFSGSGRLVDQPARTTLVTPAQAVAGVAIRPLDRLLLAVDAQWTEWSVFDRVGLEFERLPGEVLDQQYRDTWGWRVGAEWLLGARTMLRAGWTGNQAAAPAQSVTPVLPEAKRNAYTAGFGTQLGSRLAVDVAYMYLDQSPRAGRSVAGGVAQNNGTYRFDAHLVGLTLTYRLSKTP